MKYKDKEFEPQAAWLELNRILINPYGKCVISNSYRFKKSATCLAADLLF